MLALAPVRSSVVRGPREGPDSSVIRVEFEGDVDGQTPAAIVIHKPHGGKEVKVPKMLGVTWLNRLEERVVLQLD
jgi:hypothetical protein